jgi:hypothetical protein
VYVLRWTDDVEVDKEKVGASGEFDAVLEDMNGLVSVLGDMSAGRL